MTVRTIEEQRWQQAIAQGDFGVWDLDPRLELVHYSPQWKERVGHGRADTPDSTSFWRSKVHPEDIDAMLRALRLHLDGYTDTYEMRFRLRCSGPGYHLVLSRGRAVDRNHRGEAQRMVGTMVNASARPLGRARGNALPAAAELASVHAGMPLHQVLGACSLPPQPPAPAAGDAWADRVLSKDGLLAKVADLLDVAATQARLGR